MKFPQILMFLALFVMLIGSCKEANSIENEKTIPENQIPASKIQNDEKTPARKLSPRQTKKYKDSILQKRRKSKELDTLIPQVALLR